MRITLFRLPVMVYLHNKCTCEYNLFICNGKENIYSYHLMVQFVLQVLSLGCESIARCLYDMSQNIGS